MVVGGAGEVGQGDGVGAFFAGLVVCGDGLSDAVVVRVVGEAGAVVLAPDFARFVVAGPGEGVGVAGDLVAVVVVGVGGVSGLSDGVGAGVVGAVAVGADAGFSGDVAQGS